MKNQLTELLGIEHPVIQGGMMEISRARLTAAVSNAGGLGTLGQRMSLDDWIKDLEETMELTKKPFAVNLPLHTPELDKKIDVLVERKVKVVTTAAGNPARVLETLKGAGMTVMHVVASLDQAKKVETAGVDAVITEGGESGGMVAKNRVSTLVLAAEAAASVKIPVIAAGGIADSRGLMAALALGAKGVQLGTRFIACTECDAPDKWKQAVVDARDVDTMVVPRGKAQGRVLSPELMEGAMAGVVSGLVSGVLDAESIVKGMVDGLSDILTDLNSQVKSV